MSDQTGFDTASINLSSSENGWYSSSVYSTYDDLPKPADVPLYVSGVTAETGNAVSTNEGPPRFIMRTPAGHVVGLGGDSWGTGLNVFGHVCVFSGRMWGFTSSL